MTEGEHEHPDSRIDARTDAGGDHASLGSSREGRIRWPTVAAVGVIVLGVVLILVWAIGRLTLDDERAAAPLDPVVAATTAPTTPAGLGVGRADEVRGRRPLRGFGEVQATITGPDGDGCEVCLLAALTGPQQARGLMEVRDLGGYDGMLFAYDRDVRGAFYMRNTPMPLSIAFFGTDGHLVSSTDMAPCADVDDCPTHGARSPYRYALEVPEGGLDDLGITGDGATIRLDGTPCPAAADR